MMVRTRSAASLGAMSQIFTNTSGNGGRTPRNSCPLHISDQRARRPCRDQSRGRDCGMSCGTKISTLDLCKSHGITDLKIIMEGDDVAMAAGYLLEYCDFVTDLHKENV